MELKYIEGCTNYYLEIDGKYPNAYLREELVQICNKLVDKLDKSQLINFIEDLVEATGEYTFQYKCEQCGDSVGDYTINLD